MLVMLTLYLSALTLSPPHQAQEAQTPQQTKPQPGSSIVYPDIAQDETDEIQLNGEKGTYSFCLSLFFNFD